MSKEKKKSHIPMRLNFLFSLIVLLFAALVFRLIHLQIFNAQYYANTISATQAVKTTTDMTRGQIYDRNGVLLVGNQSFKTVNYTRYDNSVENMITLSTKLVDIIDVSQITISDRQLKDYWIATHAKELAQRLSKAEKQLSGAELTQAKLSKVSEEDINYSEKDKKIAMLFSKMYNTGFLEMTILKSKEVSNQEIARVSEQLTSLNGISIGTDWERTYPQGEVLRALFGNVSSQQAGLPEAIQNELLAQGYFRNSRVGTTYLEKQYDTVLRGTPKVTLTTLGVNGAVVSSQTQYEGKSGDNLYLSVDIELQKKVDNILSNFLYQLPNSNTAYAESIYAVVQKVDTGEVLAMSGKQFDYNKEEDKLIRNKVVDNVLGVTSGSYVMGSVVKPATVAAGYQYGVISETNNVILDEPMYFGAEVGISSVFNRRGSVNLTDEQALSVSSNVYMSKIAMGIGGQTYMPGVPLALKEDTIVKLRKTFSQFGLGVYTGIDLPSENKGYTLTNSTMAAVLMNAFGQFDSYTIMQVSQFMTTIANGGSRYAPQLVSAIREANQLNVTGRISTEMTPKLLNTVDITPSQMARIKNGLYRVTHEYALGTAVETFARYGVSVSGKTGTAEAVYNGRVNANSGKYVITSTFSSYAPSNNPEIAVTVVIPNLSYETEYQNYKADKIARQIYDAYFYK